MYRLTALLRIGLASAMDTISRVKAYEMGDLAEGGFLGQRDTVALPPLLLAYILCLLHSVSSQFRHLTSVVLTSLDQSFVVYLSPIRNAKLPLLLSLKQPPYPLFSHPFFTQNRGATSLQASSPSIRDASIPTRASISRRKATTSPPDQTWTSST